ncbi:MAG: diphthine synthase [Candidatus Nanoarchaeia archaeon]
MLYLVGLGLGREFDLSLRAFTALENCDYVYLEGYTGVFGRLKEFEDLLGKSIMVLSREDVESKSEFITLAKKKNVALLVQGDPLSATTHVSIVLDCIKSKVKYSVINGSSVFTAVARSGLSLYKFGKTASIPFPSKDFNPKSFYDLIKDNQSVNAHTLCLLDVKSDAHGYMTIPEAIKIIEDADTKHFLKNRFIGCARLGYPDELIKYGAASTLKRFKWGEPPFCVVIPAKKLHFMEEEAIKALSD